MSQNWQNLGQGFFLKKIFLINFFLSEKSFISGKSTSLHLSFAEDDTKRIKSLDMSVVFEPSPNVWELFFFKNFLSYFKEDNSFIADKSSQVNSVIVPLQLSPSMESERPTIEEIQVNFKNLLREGGNSLVN